MPRRKLIAYPGAIHHLIQRGNNRNYIYEKPEDKKQLLQLIVEALSKHGFKLLAYAIMDNHYHLMIQMLNDSPSKFMQRINWHYSRYYNQKYNRTGPVFDGRYKQYHVYNKAYLLALTSYIHQNPVRAGICSVSEKYTWSSSRTYSRNIQDSIVNIDVVLEIISNHRPTALKLYGQQMNVLGQLECIKQMHESQKERTVPGMLLPVPGMD